MTESIQTQSQIVDETIHREQLIACLAPLAGMRIALIAPAGGVSDARIDSALSILESAGVEALPGDHIHAHHRYLGGTTDERLADLHAAFAHADVAAVWALRGGYGTAHLAAHIDWAHIPQQVPLIGFSDITTLLEAFRQHGRVAIHGPVATHLALPDSHTGTDIQRQEERLDSLRSLVSCLQGEPARWAVTPQSEAGPLLAGNLVGGNLTTLASLAGTAHALTLRKHSILVLEDVGEAEFRLERCLHQLLGSIDTRRLVAVCLGTFEQCRLADPAHSFINICREWLDPISVPLYNDLPIGHGAENHAFRYGAMARIDGVQLTCSAVDTAEFTF